MSNRRRPDICHCIIAAVVVIITIIGIIYLFSELSKTTTGFESVFYFMIFGGFILLAILIGALKILAQCAFGKKVTNRIEPEEEEEEEEPEVTITGALPLLLKKEGTNWAALYADGTPPGGSYQWTIIEGEDKVEIISDTESQTLRLHPENPSQDKNDVVIKVDYSTDEGTASDEVALTIHKPSYSCVVSRSKRTFNGEMSIIVLGGRKTLENGPYYGYETKVLYRVLDQFKERFPYTIVFLEEDLTIEYVTHSTPFMESDYQSEPNAEYNDYYAIIFRQQPVPSNFIARVRQVVQAEGFVILNQTLLYGSADVVVGASGCNP